VPPLSLCDSALTRGIQRSRGTVTSPLRPPVDVTAIKFTAQRLKSLIPEREARESDLADILTAIDQMSRALGDEALCKHSRDTL
jgi:hypothetical protein